MSKNKNNFNSQNMRKIIYAVTGFIVGATLPLTLAPGYGYAFVGGFDVLVFFVFVILPGIVCSLISFFTGRIDDTKLRRILVGSIIAVLSIFLAFYLPTIY